MQPLRSPRHPFASIARRMLAAALVVSCAALVTVGCADADGGADGASGSEDAMAWLPADTWFVATGDLSQERIQQAVTTLDRLPAWALAEGFLPASDGAGLRLALLGELAGDAAAGAGDAPTAKELEAAFGDRIGLAIFGTDFAAIRNDANMPFLVWVEVDDEERAERIAREGFSGEPRELEHEGRTFWEQPEDEAAWTIEDGMLLLTTTPDRMRELIDVRASDDSLARSGAGAGVRAATGDAFASFALQTDPLLGSAPELARLAAQDLPEGDPDAERAAATAQRLGDALETEAVRELVPDWVGGSITIDEVGLRARAAWSNPRELADADPGPRELVELMPATVATASGVASRGDDLRRVQEAWADARDAAGLDVREAIACPRGEAWACDLAVEALLTVLEDGQLADAVAERGDTAAVIVQDIGPAVRAAGAAAKGSAATPNLEGRTLEVVVPAVEPLDWKRGEALAAAMERAGLSVEHAEGTLIVRVAPASPLGRALRAGLDGEAQAGFASLGIDASALFAPGGLRLEPEEINDLRVFGLPMDAPSAVAAELAAGDDPLGASEAYRSVVEAAGAPEEAASWGWFDLAGTVEGALEAVAVESPDVQRLLPTVRNNLADVPGGVAWSTVEEADGEDVGVAEFVLPILE